MKGGLPVPDDQPLEPLRKAEPVALLDIAKAVVAVAAFIGLDLAEDRILEIVVGVNAAIILIGATLATRRRVTPEARAKERELEAYTRGYETGETVAAAEKPAPPQATVVQVDGNPDVSALVAALRQHGVNITDQDVHPVAPPAPHPQVGLVEPADAGHGP